MNWCMVLRLGCKSSVAVSFDLLSCGSVQTYHMQSLSRLLLVVPSICALFGESSMQVYGAEW